MIFLITSFHENEGKSTLSKELVKILRDEGYKVCLIDADFYKNRKESGVGLTNYLAGDTEVNDILKDGLIECGTKKVNIFNEDRLIFLLNYLEEEFDFIFIDSAPYTLPFTLKLLEYTEHLIFIRSNKHPEIYDEYLYSKDIYEVDTIFKKVGPAIK